MNVKTTILCLCLCFGALSLTPAAVGIGVQGGIASHSELPADSDFAFKGNAALSFACDFLPWVFTVQAQIPVQYVGFTADNWVVYQPLTRALNYFVFWGISGGAALSKPYGIDTGARVGCGANLFLCARHVELYALAAWNPYCGLNLDTSDGDDRFFIYPLHVPASAGVRLWF